MMLKLTTLFFIGDKIPEGLKRLNINNCNNFIWDKLPKANIPYRA